jgi:hypothetical protein
MVNIERLGRYARPSRLLAPAAYIAVEDLRPVGGYFSAGLL